MQANFEAIDGMLASALRGEIASWPNEWTHATTHDLVQERVVYHGISGLLAKSGVRLPGWPIGLIDGIRHQAFARAMWEMRHQVVLGELLAAFAENGARAALLKGTALAYDVYEEPAERVRGDTDIVADPGQKDLVRSVLSNAGFRHSGSNDDFALQESWSTETEGTMFHHVDLHWQILNAQSLAHVLPVANCFENTRPLERLHPSAIALSRADTLLHCCVHRATHITTPYIVDGVTHYGGDRLIWIMDVHLLSLKMTDNDWEDLVARASDQGVARVCGLALRSAAQQVGTMVPDAVLDRLELRKNELASAYLLDRTQRGRALGDVRSVAGLRRKMRFIFGRLFPSAEFMRAKYPSRPADSMRILYTRRFCEFFQRRGSTKDSL